MISTNFNDPAFLSPPIINLDGFKLSAKACPSFKNSGENIIFFELYLFTNFSVNPIGIVDLSRVVDFVFDLLISGLHLQHWKYQKSLSIHHNLLELL